MRDLAYMVVPAWSRYAFPRQQISNFGPRMGDSVAEHTLELRIFEVSERVDSPIVCHACNK